MPDGSELSFPELYQMLLDAGRLTMGADGAYFLDGEELPPGTDYQETFRRALTSS